jgi:hypothetical protein
MVATGKHRGWGGGGFRERALFKETVSGTLIALLKNHVYSHWPERIGQTNTVDK